MFKSLIERILWRRQPAVTFASEFAEPLANGADELGFVPQHHVLATSGPMAGVWTRNWLWMPSTALRTISLDAVVADEAQRIKAAGGRLWTDDQTELDRTQR